VKVLITTIFAYPPRGGLGTYIQELKKGLEQNGHIVDVLARHRDKYYLTKGEKQYPLNVKSQPKSFLPLPQVGKGTEVQKFTKEMRVEAAKFLNAVEAIDLSQYNIIHAQDIVSSTVLRYYKPRRIPVVMTVHGCVTAEYYYYGLIKPNSVGWKILSSYESEVIRSNSHTIVPSKWLVGVYKQCGIPTQNMTVIPNGINVKAFERQMRQSTGLVSPANKTIILCTGRLVKVKGQHILLEALAKLRSQVSNWVCWIAGKGEAEKSLKKKVAALGLERYVKFLGRRSDVPALLKQAHIVVIPSLQDNYPYSLVEAQVAGKAVIASQVGGITEMIEHGKTGLLVPPGDSRKLSEQLLLLSRNQELRDHLAKQSRDWATEHFSLEKMTVQVEGIYKSAISGYKRSGRSEK